MAHESFEDVEIAATMNAGFINIKVDREQRPDIDALYMDAVQAMTGRGGWPNDGLSDAGWRALLRRHVLPARTAPWDGLVSSKSSKPSRTHGSTAATSCFPRPMK